MKIGNISNNINFGRVYALAGTKEQLNQAKQIVEETKGYGLFFDATDLYKKSPAYGLCTDAVQRGQDVAFVVAGKEDCNNVNFMRHGWSSLNGISHHIDRFIELYDVKKQTRAIKMMMQKRVE
ncbi:hypothetical protein J6Q66_04495 [bacterium]|nr:hypothetical protein [bacterium]